MSSIACDVVVYPAADDDRPSTSAAIDAASKTHERKSSSDDGIHYVDDDDGVEFALDARHLNRVHEELEKLNIATDVINKLELQLDDARMQFRQIHSKWSQHLDELCKKYGTAIQKSRPYYEEKNQERKLREEAQNAAIRFERANSMLHVAKQQVKLTQDSLNRQSVIEPECLEVLNHHIQRVSEAESERTAAGEAHRSLSQRMLDTAQRIKQMEKENSRSIKKSRQYFEMCMEFRRKLDHQKAVISRLEKEVKQKKCDYTTSMNNLEQISESIHEERSITSMKRSSGRATPDTDRKDFTPSKMRTSASMTAASDVSSGGSLGDADFDDSDANSLKRESIISEFYANADPATMFDDELESIASSSSAPSSTDLGARAAEKRARRPEVLERGVVLLAQQLMSNSSQKEPEYPKKDQIDVCYQTKPEGIGPLPASSDYGSGVSDSSAPSSAELLVGGRPMRRSVSDVDAPAAPVRF